MNPTTQHQSPLTALPLTLTIEEAAKVLRLGRSAAYAAARSGDLPTIRVGKSYRVPRHQLERMLGFHNDFEAAGNGLEVQSPPGVATDAPPV